MFSGRARLAAPLRLGRQHPSGSLIEFISYRDFSPHRNILVIRFKLRDGLRAYARYLHQLSKVDELVSHPCMITVHGDRLYGMAAARTIGIGNRIHRILGDHFVGALAVLGERMKLQPASTTKKQKEIIRALK